MEKVKNTPLVLAILDGWGISHTRAGNAIFLAKPTFFNSLWKNYPHTILQSFKEIAGDYKVIADSTIGHASIGAGRVVLPDLARISNSIEDKSFYQNPALVAACDQVKIYNSSLHLIGLLSDAGIHSHINHLIALLRLAKLQEVAKVYIHVITDGVNSEDGRAIEFIENLESQIAKIGCGEIATVSGRDFALDRNNRWEKISKSLRAMVAGGGNFARSARDAVVAGYKNRIPDQDIPPTVIIKNQRPIAKISDNDSVVFFNFRPDRSHELLLALLGYHRFRSKFRLPKRLKVCTLASYSLPPVIAKDILIAFLPEKIEVTLGKIISAAGLRQLRIAESEKYPHISYFFNCGFEEILPGEDRIIINSLDEKSFSQMPEMRAKEIREKVIMAIKSQKYHFILVNFANPDLVAHSGDLLATTAAIKIVDKCLSDLWLEIEKVDGTLIITADHGNAEQVIFSAKIRDRQSFHPLSPVPFILVRKDFRSDNKIELFNQDILSQVISSKNSLADIAPTILELLEIEKPAAMSGKSLLKLIIRP